MRNQIPKTPAEAIEIIENYEVLGCGICHTGYEDVIVGAFNMAIEALKECGALREKLDEMKLRFSQITEDKAHAYRVACAVGGLMENPGFTYENEQIIFADNEEEARSIYDVRNNCSYFRASIRGQLY